ncbi:uncharacterized protein PADG_00399 [Paracoccidioides brasiliensis Pb18]|uniref:Uncharacterized protein n=2 Tax=Paracoccidioides brasiliensis TaxID=121759 RepID=C1G0K9_PARBD|nr:uncharacterized protein PADG_00399 [Paracoccidioides brasiliensis Pb18]EEH44110.1 hypothetical protein PADG_00399 [Paracoccidioides brasiliensis Pb18]ODH27604.1 hypothetical protein ACO22_04139 [Paracoccidioides brasiliensis]
MSRYAAAHANPQEIPDFTSKMRAWSTNWKERGGDAVPNSRGLGKSQNRPSGKKFSQTGCTLVQMDQASLESVRNAAMEILEKTDKVNILINNAGVMAPAGSPAHNRRL